ncbi:pentapeptide repeat-containing protein [Antarctobacter jejuensis]|uniref:pentapeptide repeat-containing protein n=1 Tax=Antarctobacter jejuensis TaxID=1439938 RepID=UPI003FCF8BE0
MSTDEETSVDRLIAEYDAIRLAIPKLKLPEVSAENREYLVACNKGKGSLGAFAHRIELFPVYGYVFLGSWNSARDMGLTSNHNCRNTTWFKCQLQGNYENLDLSGVRFIECELVNISLSGSNLTNVAFENCTFIRAELSDAIYENVKVTRPVFKHYDPIGDDLDRVNFGWNSWFFDWAKLRILSKIPMFSISWSTLLGSLAVMNIIGWGSANRNKLSTVVEPLNMPTTLVELFIAALFLAIASTLYSFYCPPQIKEISETEWADKQDKPRLKYYSNRFPYRWSERAAIVAIYTFGTFGLILTTKLVTERIGSAYCYTMNWETPEQCEGPQPLQ